MLTTSVALRGSAEPSTAPPDTPPAPPSSALYDLRWITRAACPADWWAHVERCGGGFFHTPPGLEAGAPTGEAVFAQLLHGQDVVGIAAGVRSQCRLGRQPRHLYFPTAPAFRGLPRPDDALGALAEALRIEGAAEVAVDSFDAGWQPDVTPGRSIEMRDRVEYLVPLDRSPDELMRGCSRHHRRHLQNGIRQDWSFQTLDGPGGGARRSIPGDAACRGGGRDRRRGALGRDDVLRVGEGGAARCRAGGLGEAPGVLSGRRLDADGVCVSRGGVAALAHHVPPGGRGLHDLQPRRHAGNRAPAGRSAARAVPLQERLRGRHRLPPQCALGAPSRARGDAPAGQLGGDPPSLITRRRLSLTQALPLPIPRLTRVLEAGLQKVRAHPMLNPVALEELWHERAGHAVDPTHGPHLLAALDWLARAQAASGDGGFARGYSLAWNPYFRSRGWQPSYPETTGYIIPTFYLAARHLGRPELAQCAERAAHWEVEVQLPSGAVRGGVMGEHTAPAVFNTGQVLFGWLAAFGETGSGVFAGAARRAACFLLATLDEDGLWRRGNSRFADARATLYNT